MGHVNEKRGIFSFLPRLRKSRRPFPWASKLALQNTADPEAYSKFVFLGDNGAHLLAPTLTITRPNAGSA